ncbi:MAG: SLC13 family permease [Peptococcaceae bacterium]
MKTLKSRRTKIKVEKNIVVFYFLFILLIITGVFSKTEGLAVKTLLILVFATISWVRRLVPTSVTCFAILSLLPLNQILSFSESVSGFGSSSIWLLLSSFILSAAIRETGLGRRLALCIIWFGRGRSAFVVLTTFITVLVFTFIIPSTVGRVAILAPICYSMISTIKELASGGTGNLAKEIFIGISVSSLLSSSMVMTGSMGTVYAVGMFEALLNYRWEYTEWFKVFFPGALLNIIMVWFVLLKIFPLEFKKIPGGSNFIISELKKLGKLSNGELKLSFIMFLMMILWFTSHWHGYSVVLIALLGALVTMLPRLGVIDWEQASKEINWDIIIVFGASLALASAIQKADLIRFIAQNGYLSNLEAFPYLIAVLLYIILVVIRVGFVSVVAVMSVTLPLVFNFAFYLNYNPIWFGLMGVLASSRCFLLPMQAPTILLTYGLGFYDVKDMLRAGIFITIGNLVIDLITIFIYWPIIGLRP